jgi:NAD(P)-dependent dehydrogenase (short-subunit alcohol dehydrogenase family)
MGKLDGKVTVITGASSGMALASAKLFVEECAYVFITGRRQDKLDEAVKVIGRNVTAVQGDSANPDDVDRLYETVKNEKGHIDVLFASAGQGGSAMLGEITVEQFDKLFALNTRGTLFTAQKALRLFREGLDRAQRLDCQPQGNARVKRLQRKQGCTARVCPDLGAGAEKSRDSGKRVEPGTDRYSRL